MPANYQIRLTPRGVILAYLHITGHHSKDDVITTIAAKNWHPSTIALAFDSLLAEGCVRVETNGEAHFVRLPSSDNEHRVQSS